MRFQFQSTLTIKIFLWIIITISILAVILGILALCGVHIEISNGQAILLVSVFSLTLLVSLLLATIHYKIDTTFVHLNIAFVDMLSNRIRIDKILNIVIDDDKLYISYLWKGPDPVIALVAISPKRYEQFKKELISLNPNIIFYENKKDETADSEQ